MGDFDDPQVAVATGHGGAIVSREPFEFARERDGTISVRSAVFQALGAASMCWTSAPQGVFDSTRAKEIGDKLLEIIEREHVALIERDAE